MRKIVLIFLFAFGLSMITGCQKCWHERCIYYYDEKVTGGPWHTIYQYDCDCAEVDHGIAEYESPTGEIWYTHRYVICH